MKLRETPIDAYILSGSCPFIDVVSINPLFAEVDLTRCAVRYVCDCGDVHETPFAADKAAGWVSLLAEVGCRVFSGEGGDRALAWRNTKDLRVRGDQL